MTSILEASAVTLSDRKLFIAFLALCIIFFIGMFSIPLYSIPGNDLKLQMTIFKAQDYALLAVLSLLSSLTIVIQANIFLQKFVVPYRNGNAVLGGVGVLSGVFSSIFASATCAMCVGSLFGFLGFGSILFLVQNRWYILIGASLLLIISLYLASRRLVEGCKLCVVKPAA